MSTKINQSQLIDQTFKKIKKEYPELATKHVVSKEIVTDIIRTFFQIIKINLFQGAPVVIKGLVRFEIVEKKVSNLRPSNLTGERKLYKPSCLRLKTTPSVSLQKKISRLGRF